MTLFASDLNQESWHFSHRAERDYSVSVSHLRALQPRIIHLKVTNLCLCCMSQCNHPAEQVWAQLMPAASYAIQIPGLWSSAAPAQPQVSPPPALAAVSAPTAWMVKPRISCESTKQSPWRYISKMSVWGQTILDFKCINCWCIDSKNVSQEASSCHAMMLNFMPAL